MLTSSCLVRRSLRGSRRGSSKCTRCCTGKFAPLDWRSAAPGRQPADSPPPPAFVGCSEFVPTTIRPNLATNKDVGRTSIDRSITTEIVDPEHVGKTEDYMLAHVHGETYNILGILVVGLSRSGSFTSIQTANKLVNSTLAQNYGIVESVASGIISEAFVTSEFGSVTGSEAYRSSPTSEPYIRTTTSVGVKIRHDARQPRGFRVHTAYPYNN